MQNQPNEIKVEKTGLFWIFLSIAFLIWFCIIFSLAGKDLLYIDEDIHTEQISLFLKGDMSLSPKLTLIPGYHFLVAGIYKIIAWSLPENIVVFRLISLILSLGSICMFYLFCKKNNVKNYFLRILQCIFLPISFLYFPLAYTDIFSLFLILAAFYTADSRRYGWSAIFSFVSVLVRQNNIIWVAFFWLYLYLMENSFSFSIKSVMAHIRRTWGYLVAFIFFLLFVWINKGLAMGDREMHQFGFYMGNIYFFFALIGVLFLPIFIKRIFSFKKIQKIEIIGIIIGAILAILFAYFRPSLHYYNFLTHFLRNNILQSAYYQYPYLYGLAIWIGAITLSSLKFEKTWFLILPFIFIYLVPSFLIDQRYLIVPIMFLLLFRKELDSKTESILLFYFFLLCWVILYAVFKLGLAF